MKCRVIILCGFLAFATLIPFVAFADPLDLSGVSIEDLHVWKQQIDASLMAAGEFPFVELYESFGGTDVIRLQTRLKELGFYSRDVDGRYRDSTRGAVIAFCKANDISANGRATVEIQNAIFSNTAKSKDGVVMPITIQDAVASSTNEPVSFAPTSQPATTSVTSTPAPSDASAASSHSPVPVSTHAPTVVPIAPSETSELRSFSFRNGVVPKMTMEQVIECEGRQPDGTNSSEGSIGIMYKTAIAQLDAELVYMFIDDQLAFIYVRFTQEHENRNLFISDYETVGKALFEKFGESLLGAQMDWSSDLYKDRPDDYGLAVSEGHLAYRTSWVLPAFILHELSGDEDEIRHAIAMYVAPDLSQYDSAVDSGL